MVRNRAFMSDGKRISVLGSVPICFATNKKIIEIITTQYLETHPRIVHNAEN